MPKQTPSQLIGRKAERWLANALPPNWVLNPPLDDVGLDGTVVICEEGPLDGLEFRVQVKGSHRWRRKAGRISLRVKRQTLLYWITGFTPTLLIFRETGSDSAEWGWVNQIVGTQPHVLTSKERDVTLTVHPSWQFTTEAWEAIGRGLYALTRHIGARIVAAGKALPLLRAIHELLAAARAIDFVASAKKAGGDPVTNEDRLELAKLEITAHRDVIRAIRRLDADLRENDILLDGLEQFASGYLFDCTQFTTDFENFVNAPTAPQIVRFSPSALALARPRLIRTIIAAAHQLTAFGLDRAQP